MADTQLSLITRDRGLKEIDALGADLGLANRAEIIGRALALTRTLLDLADENGAVTIVDRNGDRQKIILIG